MKYKFFKFVALAILILVGSSYLKPNTAHGIALCSTVGIPKIQININGVNYISDSSHPEASFSVTLPSGTTTVPFSVYTYAEPSSQNTINYPGSGGVVTYSGPLSSGRSYITSAISGGEKIIASILQNCSPAGDGPSNQITISLNIAPTPIDGVCAADHFNCTVGTSVNNGSNSLAWSWVCNGSNGGTNASCSQSKTGPNPSFPDLIAGPMSVSPSNIAINMPVTFSSSVKNVGTVASSVATINNVFQFDDNDNHDVGVTTSKVPSSGVLAPNGSVPISTTHSFATAGVKYARVCVDNDASFNGLVQETDESNNCLSPWISFSIASPPSAPTVTLTQPIATSTSAVTGGNITSVGSSLLVKARGVVWSKFPVQHPDISFPKTNEGQGGVGPYVSNISGLSPGTLYYIKAYATSDTDTVTVYSPESSFSTDPIDPTVMTAPVQASTITQTTATGGGEVKSTGSSSIVISQMGIIWSTSSSNLTTALSTKTEECDSGFGCFGSFTSNMTGLSPDTTYYVKAYATSYSGKTGYANNTVSFKTAAANVVTVPTVYTNTSCTSITKNSLVSGGDVKDDGGASVSIRGVTINTFPNPDISKNRFTDDGPGTGVFTSKTITGLAANTLYHIRAFAKNSQGIAYGADEECTTLPENGLAPEGTLSASPISCKIAENQKNCSVDLTWTLKNPLSTSVISANGIDDVTVSNSATPTSQSGSKSFPVPDGGRTFYLKTSSSSSTLTLAQTSVNAQCDQNLVPTGGFCRAGPSTEVPTVITNPSCTSITKSTLTSGGDVKDGGGSAVSVRGVAYSGTVSIPTITNGAFTVNGMGTGLFSSPLTALTANKTYHIRAYATNGVGTGYGSPVDCTTTAPDLTAGDVSPTTAIVGVGTTFSSTISNSADATANLTLNHLFRYDDDSDHTAGITSSVSTTSGSIAAGAGGSKIVSDSHTFATTGDKYVSVCADNDASFVGKVAETDEGNNCGNWTKVTVSEVGTMTGSLTANPPSCTIGLNENSCSVDLSWNVNYPKLVSQTGITSNTDNSGNNFPNFKIVYNDTNPQTTGNYDAGTKTNVTVPYNSGNGRTFYLYNSEKSLFPPTPDYTGAGLKVTAHCASNLGWDSATQTCVSDITNNTLLSSLEVNVLGRGSVNLPGITFHNPGDVVTLFVTQDVPNSRFDHWSCDNTNSPPSSPFLSADASISVTMDTNKTCTATFFSDAPQPPAGVCKTPSIYGAIYGDKHYECESGTPSNQVNGIKTWTWDCENTHCSETKRATDVHNN